MYIYLCSAEGGSRNSQALLALLHLKTPQAVPNHKTWEPGKPLLANLASCLWPLFFFLFVCLVLILGGEGVEGVAVVVVSASTQEMGSRRPGALYNPFLGSSCISSSN